MFLEYETQPPRQGHTSRAFGHINTFSFGCHIPHLRHGGFPKVTSYGFINSCEVKEIRNAQVAEYLIRLRYVSICVC